MAVKTDLTWIEEKNLQQLLGFTSLSLLYKSNVHGYDIKNILQKCSHQGSTITLIYDNYCNKIHGIFIIGHYPGNDEESNSNSSFYFSWQRTTKKITTEIATFAFNKPPEITKNCLKVYSDESLFFHLLSRNNSFYVEYKLSKNKFKYLNDDHQCECEVFRVEGIKDDPNYIKKITGFTQHRNYLLNELRAYKPCSCLTPEIHILLLGPIGSGKSTFINSVKSVFRGRIVHQAPTGSDSTGITKQYRIYSLKDGKDGMSLPFRLCDTMGLDEKEEAGLCIEDIPYILKGCIPDKYQFNPQNPITPFHSSYITSPSPKERIHCVAYVFDVNSINNLSSKMVGKFQRIQKEVLNCGIAHMVLFTNVNNWDEIFQGDFPNMNRSKIYRRQITRVVDMLTIPISNILMVENYSSERQLEPFKDSLILSVVRQMLRTTDDFLEDLPSE